MRFSRAAGDSLHACVLEATGNVRTAGAIFLNRSAADRPGEMAQGGKLTPRGPIRQLIRDGLREGRRTMHRWIRDKQVNGFRPNATRAMDRSLCVDRTLDPEASVLVLPDAPLPPPPKNHRSLKILGWEWIFTAPLPYFFGLCAGIAGIGDNLSGHRERKQ